MAADKTFKSTYLRMKLVIIVIALAFIAIFVQTVRLQVVDGERYRKMVNNNSKRKVPVLAERGDILARDGRKLACSVPSYRPFVLLANLA